MVFLKLKVAVIAKSRQSAIGIIEVLIIFAKIAVAVGWSEGYLYHFAKLHYKQSPKFTAAAATAEVILIAYLFYQRKADSLNLSHYY